MSVSAGSKLGDRIKANRWWQHKLVFLVGVAATVLLATDSGRPDSVGQLGLRSICFVVSVIGIAGAGHFINDWSDEALDRRASKHNIVIGLGLGTRVAALIALAILGFGPWLLVDAAPALWLLLAIQIVLFAAYSIRPVRLKDRSTFGAVADALYGYVVPVLITIVAFGSSRGASLDGLLTTGLTLWAGGIGLRSIVNHQLDDGTIDAAQATITLVAARGRTVANRVLLLAVVIEVLGFVVVSLALPARARIWWVLAVVILALWKAATVVTLWPADPRTIVRQVGDHLNTFWEQRWPIVPLALVVAYRLELWPLTVVAAALFPAIILNLLGETTDLSLVIRRLPRPDEWARATSRAEGAASQQATEAVPAPDRSVAEESGPRRWVFVVCGPDQHLATLRRSLDHIADHSDLEAWVITDSARNDWPIETAHLVDVATPEHLNNHQASIWLKTSLHRHLPTDGRWCYLDSDVLAISPEVDNLFDHYTAPISFAPDLTVRDNCVERFSPWAVECACTGHGDTSSCDHLQQAIQERFGLSVAGDWVHWNGGVFCFDRDSTAFLDRWHEWTVAAFDHPYWSTRDQGTLIATVWSMGLSDQPTLPRRFNFIVDLGNTELCYHGDDRYSLTHAETPIEARFLHCYSSELERPEWNRERDLDEVIIHNMEERRRADRRRSRRARLGRIVGYRPGLRRRIRHRLSEIGPLHRLYRFVLRKGPLDP